jgi:hypothetical protein
MSGSRITADAGVLHISSADGAVAGRNLFGFTVLEDTVVSVCTLNTTPSGYANTDYKTGANLTGKTLKAGAYVCAPKNTYIVAITLTSGSIMAYNSVS